MRLAAVFQNERAQGDVIIDVIGVGAPKCGTSWLARCLSEHPSVGMADPATLNYFCDDMIWPEFRAPAGLGSSWLAERFAYRRAGQKLAEISPNYLYDESSPRRIFDHNPRCKLIFAFRHPVEMLNSFYYQIGKESPLPSTLEGFILKYPEIRRLGLYYLHLQRFLQVFPRNQCLFLLFDDIQSKPADVMKRCFEFLEVAPDFKPAALHQRINERTVPRSQMVMAALNRVRHLLQSHTSQRLWHLLVWKLNLYRFHRWILRRNLKPAQTGPIKQETREVLLEYFREDTRALGGFLGRDLSSWEH